MIHTPETDAADFKRRHDEQSDKCFAGSHVPVRCSITDEVMCKHCGEHGIKAGLVLDLAAACKVHGPGHSDFSKPFPLPVNHLYIDEDARRSEIEARRASIPGPVRYVMQRDVHLRALLGSWVASGHVPADIAEWFSGEPKGFDKPEVKTRPGSLEDALCLAIVGMVANKQAMMAAFAARQQG